MSNVRQIMPKGETSVLLRNELDYLDSASGASTSGTDVVSRILLGLQTMQNELKSVRQGQDETARMVQESQIESARISAKGKKPAYTFKKKGNESSPPSSTR